MTTARMTTARWTGLFYLGIAVSGVLGFFVARGQIWADGDSAATLANLIEHDTLARFGIAADLTVVVTQALAAMGFYRLFRAHDRLSAASIAGFGLVNAAAILMGTVCTASALAVAGDASLAPGGDQAGTAQLLYHLSNGLWDIGGLFFGLWLIPMGWVVLKARVMPAALGWFLVVGGVGYILASYIGQLAPDAPGAVAGVLTAIATVGEFWMIGYLLVFGIRGNAPEPKVP
ncbi:MAG: DUF4386 domain-containing protein [Thermoleophilia bacterium]